MIEAIRESAPRRRTLEAMLYAANIELALAAAIVAAENPLADAFEEDVFLGVLFLGSMALWHLNRRGRTLAASLAFAGLVFFACSVAMHIHTGRQLWMIPALAFIAAAGYLVSRMNGTRVRAKRHPPAYAEFVRLAAFGQAAAGLFHDLANPLMAVSLAVTRIELEAGSAVSADVRESVRTALNAAQRIEDQLARARSQLQAAPAPQTFDAAEELQSVARALSAVARERCVTVACEATAPLMLHGDPAQFYRAFSNLIANAIESNDPRRGGTVRISIRRGARGSEILVADTGAGMDRATLLRAARPFFTTKHDGLGLGVSIARDALASEFGAALSFSSKPGQGTTATVSFPPPLG